MLGLNYFKRHWNTPFGYKDVLRIGLPLLAGMASSTVMQFTDRLFLGWYSLDAIAAALPASLASMTLHMTLYGLCSYAGVLAAQYVGARTPKLVGPAIWQGIWCAILCTVVLILSCFLARPLFEFVGHVQEIRELEITYFTIITSGSSLALFSAAVSAYFYGRGLTKPIMVANAVAAVINIPLDYVLIFGWGSFPELGISGAGYATCVGWLFGLLVLSLLVFTKKNDEYFCVLSGWKPNAEIFKKLIMFGAPSSIQFCVEFIAMTWFSFEIGTIGKIEQAASNIAFSVNSLTFTPMLGLSMAASTLVGQAMGRRKPLEAETAAYHALHLALFYMITTALLIALFAGNIVDVFKSSSDLDAAFFPEVRATGIILLYYVALYSLVDATNLIFFGALKGAGDTVMVMKMIIVCVTLCMFIPIFILKHTGYSSLHSLWIVFTSYIFILAVCCTVRFKGGKWHHIKMVDMSTTGIEAAQEAHAEIK